MRGLFYGYGFSLVLQALFIAALTLFAVLGMFPNIIISSHAPDTVSLFSSVLPASD